MLVNSKELLKEALKEGYAIPSYNINNLEWTRFILEECNSNKSPVILAVTPSAINYFGGEKVVYSVVTALIKVLDIKVPVILHLDHGRNFEDCKRAIDAGFTSVMIDSSNKSLEENINETNKVIDYAAKNNVTVEAEIGNIINEELTSLEDAITLVRETNVNSLAPYIGNKHGIYEYGDTLDFELLGQICKNVKIPLVLHGASGLDENKIKTAIFCGVSKINFNTDLQIAWTNSIKTYLEYNKDVYDPRKIIKSGEKALKRVISEKNTIIGSKNRAN